MGDLLKDFDKFEDSKASGFINKTNKAKRDLTSFLKKAVSMLMCLAILLAMFLMEFGTLVPKKQDILSLFAGAMTLFLFNMLFSSTTRDWGIKEAKLTHTYIYNKERKLKTVDNITQEQMLSLDKQCEQLTSQDCEAKKRRILASEAVSYDTYKLEYLGKDRKEIKALKNKYSFAQRLKFLLKKNKPKREQGLSKIQIKAILKCNRLKPAVLTAEMLTRTDCKQDSAKYRLSPTQTELNKTFFLKKVLTKVFFTFFFAYLTMPLFSDFSLASLGWLLTKVLFLIWGGVTSYFEAFSEVIEIVVGRMNEQLSILKQLGITIVDPKPKSEQNELK